MTKVYPAIIHEENGSIVVRIRDYGPGKDGHAINITTDINKYGRETKAVKKMLSIPAWLAKEAEARNLSLSKVLQEALQERLHMT